MRSAFLVLTAFAVACSANDNKPSPPANEQGAPPNIVFVLTDDLAWNLVQYMPNVLQMQADGTTFTHYFVTDSLCCPSRSSMFSGRYPHDTGVFTNGLPDGGFMKFYQSGGEQNTWATALNAGGYRTAMMGKYLNGYGSDVAGSPGPTYVPPGWAQWNVSDNGYQGFNYNLNVNGTVSAHGQADSDYFTDVMSNYGQGFIADAIANNQTFIIELASFAPHAPYVAAPRDVGAHASISAPRTSAFNIPTSPSEPPWLQAITTIPQNEIDTIDADFRKRADAVLAVDAMIGTIRAELAAGGLTDNTYVVFASDNGYHMGEHRLRPGKQTAFDTDINVPLIVVGPGVPAGRTTDTIVSNIDLCPTFAELGGGSAPANVDGRSLAGLFKGDVDDWRTVTLVEHHGPSAKQDDEEEDLAADPDAQKPNKGNPPTYAAIRFATASYVEYETGDLEYYDIASDPDEISNLASTLSQTEVQQLHAILQGVVNCHDSDTCWAAQHSETPVQ